MKNSNFAPLASAPISVGMALVLCFASCQSQTKDNPDREGQAAIGPDHSLESVGMQEAGAPASENGMPGGNMPGHSEPEIPWTDHFRVGTVVVAQDIVVEGPPGLLAHTALTSDLTRYTVHQETTERGFLQKVTARPEVLREVRCHLDEWVLSADNSITVLERPGPCDVVVTATGSATVSDVNGKRTSKEELVFVGRQP